MTRNSPDSRSAASPAVGWPGMGSPSQPPTPSVTGWPASANPPVDGQAARAGRADQVEAAAARGRRPPQARSAAAASAEQDQARAEYPVHRDRLPSGVRQPTAISRAYRMPNGRAGTPAATRRPGPWRRRPPVTASLPAQQAAADRVGADRDHDLRIGHAVVGGAQRAGHAARPGPGDQQHVGVPGAGGEEDAQPVDVVDRVEQGLRSPAPRCRPTRRPRAAGAPQRRSAAVRPASRARAARTAASVSGSSGTTSCSRVSAAGPVAPWDQPKTSGRSATQRPHRMHRPWSSAHGAAGDR